MMMPLAYNACHCAGLTYEPFGGGRFELGFGTSGAIGTNSTRTGPLVAGDQLAPPSRLNSVKMSKKLVIRYVPSGCASSSTCPRDGSVGLSRIITPLGRLMFSIVISVS